MNLRSWRAKAAVQQVFSVAPGGHHLNYLLQRYAFRSLPMSEAKLDELVALARHHAGALRRHGAVPIDEARFFEFGAGWDLGMPLALRSMGAMQQLVVDVRRLVREDLVHDIAARLRARDLPVRIAVAPNDLDRLLEDSGITYRAPCDARATGEPTASIDYVTSTNTLEHIPPAEISAILVECRRLLSPGGAMSFQVDYKDHFSYFDRRVDAFGFLRYSSRRWRAYNSSLHHQNRLRHSDYLKLYADAGFDVVEERCTEGSVEDVRRIAELPVHEEFGRYTREDLAIRESRVVLRPRGAMPSE